MDNKEEKIEKEEKKETKKKSSKYRKLIERYKRRNRIVEVIIACVVLVIAFVIACNPTFLKTSYTKEVGNAVLNIDLPRFTYYVSSDDDTIVFKTLRKSANTKAFFESFLESGRFDFYTCDKTGDTRYYYDSVGKYFIYDIKVEKTFAIKTITIKYTTVDYNSLCDRVEPSFEDEV